MKAMVSFPSNEAFTVRPRLIPLQEDVACAPIMSLPGTTGAQFEGAQCGESSGAAAMALESGITQSLTSQFLLTTASFDITSRRATWMLLSPQ